MIRLLGAGSEDILISPKLDNKTTENELSKIGMKDFFKASMSEVGVDSTLPMIKEVTVVIAIGGREVD